MKHWTKKALSLALVAVMLVSMIPMGIFSASALDYSKSEFSIANANDWNEVAAYSAANPSARFTGKTIKLAKSIDFGGATIPTLLANNFEGTFDGQGYTISNFKTTTGAVIANVTNAGSVIKNVKVDGAVEYNTYHTDGTNGWQVWAGMIINRMDEGTVTDISVAGSITSNAYNVGAVAGLAALADGKKATLQNVNVSATVNNNRTKITVGWHTAGGVLGSVETLGRSSELCIKNVNMSGTVTRTDGPAGGILGTVYYRNDGVPLYTSGIINIENCQMSGTVTSATGRAGNGVGGIVGAFGAFKKETNDYSVFDGTMNINNCVVSGTIKNTNTTSGDALAVGGVIGSYAYCNATVNVEHCLITASFPSQSLTATNGKGAGLILGAGACQAMSTLNVNNTVSTANGAMIGHVIAREGSGVAWIALNGKNQSSVTAPNKLADNTWLYTNSINDGSVLTVSADVANAMLKKDDAGFIKRVGGQITALAVQDNVPDGATLTANNTYAIRFIGVSQVSNIASASMKVIVRDTASGVAFKQYEKACDLYDALNAYAVDGAKLAYYKATDFGAKKFLALTIGGVPGGDAYTFEFTPSYTTTTGLTVTAETISITYDKNGQYVAAKASFDVAEPILAPTVRVMSSNILVADNSDGAQLPNADKNGNRLTHEQRYEKMAQLFNFYAPDFIGLQEVGDSPKVNDVNSFDGTKTMQSVLLSYMNSAYKYVDFSSKLGGNSHFTPILYNSEKWEVVTVDYDTTKECLVVACTMHRWQWARFRSVENPAYEVIVFNLHGPHNGLYHGATVKDAFFKEANTQLKKLEAQYPSIPIFVTGDYNASPADPEMAGYLTTMAAGTTLVNTRDLAANAEPNNHGSIDHIYLTNGDATVLQNRSVYNLTAVRLASDHAPVFVDARLNKLFIQTPGSSMGWGEGEVLS